MTFNPERFRIVQRVKRKTLKQHQGAERLSLSVRQVKRLCKAYQSAGAAGLISKRRGRPSNNPLLEKTINKARQLLPSRYHDFGPTLATEKLAIVGVSLSVETVRQLLIGEGLWKAKRVSMSNTFGSVLERFFICSSNDLISAASGVAIHGPLTLN